ncbi:MAG: hypothetical protein LT080_13795 [Thiobacillus sp.]|nr:hypothetical protein [Thiobacillus sp.]
MDNGVPRRAVPGRRFFWQGGDVLLSGAIGEEMPPSAGRPESTDADIPGGGRFHDFNRQP